MARLARPWLAWFGSCVRAFATDPAPVVIRSGAVQSRGLLTQAYDDLQLFVLEAAQVRLICGPETSLAPVRTPRRPPTWFDEAHRRWVEFRPKELGQPGWQDWGTQIVACARARSSVVGVFGRCWRPRAWVCAWMPLPVRSSQLFRPLVAKREINTGGGVLGLQEGASDQRKNQRQL